MFSQRSYLLITLGISVAFALLLIPTSVLPRKHITLWQVLLIFFNALLFFQVQFWIHYFLRYHNNRLQNWLSNQSLSVNRLLRGVISSVGLTTYCVVRLYLDKYLGLNLDDNSLAITLVLAQLLMVVGLPFQLAIELVESSRHLTLENEALKREQLQARYESLKQQLSPHFLFNSLSTLGDLIYDEPAAAALFVEEMAQVYRYLLRYGEQPAVPLRDELAFLRSYFYLLQMRFGEGIQLEVDLPTAIEERMVPPLALQLLMENAVKHNTVSRRQPLRVRIDFVEPAILRVHNTRIPRLVPEPSSGIGLSNLTNRVRLLHQQSLLIEQTTDEFLVYIPLPA